MKVRAAKVRKGDAVLCEDGKRRTVIGTTRTCNPAGTAENMRVFFFAEVFTDTGSESDEMVRHISEIVDIVRPPRGATVAA